MTTSSTTWECVKTWSSFDLFTHRYLDTEQPPAHLVRAELTRRGFILPIRLVINTATFLALVWNVLWWEWAVFRWRDLVFGWASTFTTLGLLLSAVELVRHALPPASELGPMFYWSGSVAVLGLLTFALLLIFRPR